MHKVHVFKSTAGLTLQAAPGQACDQCRKRKARCNRAHPCTHCQRTGQTCSYEQAPKIRGRKPRKRVLDQEPAQHPEPAEDRVAWPETLRDLTCFHIPPSGITDDQQPSLTPSSGLGWQTPCVISTPDLPHDLLKRPASSNTTWFDPCCVGASPQLLGRECFAPYVHLFLERLYAVFPIVDKDQLLGIIEPLELQSKPLAPSLYTFLTALSATVIVQLNLSDDDVLKTVTPCPDLTAGTCKLPPTLLSPELLVAQCLETRRSSGFIEDADEWTILTSFFLFEYHGQNEQSHSAWYYLREAIGFAQSLGLDDPDSYLTLDLKTSQRRRLLFWLLFITERAYALQCRSRVMLQRSIGLPHIFESPEPKLMFGFVTLARTFSAVDNAFITAWRSRNTQMLPHLPDGANEALRKLLQKDSEINTLESSELDETQRLDILVTQQWLKTLAWQLQCNVDVSKGANALEAGCGNQACTRNSACVIDASKSLLEIVHNAKTTSLEAHGIGMEQKVFDVAICLCHVLETSDEPEVALEFFSTQDFLHQFMVFLADFRRRESQYLQPLLQRASRSLSSFIEPQRPLLLEEERGQDWLGDDVFTNNTATRQHAGNE